jgi:hypothetical protein
MIANIKLFKNSRKYNLHSNYINIKLKEENIQHIIYSDLKLIELGINYIADYNFLENKFNKKFKNKNFLIMEGNRIIGQGKFT